MTAGTPPPETLVSLPFRSHALQGAPKEQDEERFTMGFIERRDGRYRARYRDPLGRQRSETFRRKADAERFLRELQVDVERGRWLDPSGADLPLATWAAEFLLFARRLSPSTQETYRRDLERYILPRFGDYRRRVDESTLVQSSACQAMECHLTRAPRAAVQVQRAHGRAPRSTPAATGQAVCPAGRSSPRRNAACHRPASFRHVNLSLIHI